MFRRILTILTVALVMTAMMMASAVPAFAGELIDADVNIGNTGDGSNDCNGIHVEVLVKDKCND